MFCPSTELNSEFNHTPVHEPTRSPLLTFPVSHFIRDDDRGGRLRGVTFCDSAREGGGGGRGRRGEAVEVEDEATGAAARVRPVSSSLSFTRRSLFLRQLLKPKNQAVEV